MNILALTARLPYPPTRGDRLRAYHFSRVLGTEHKIHLASFVEDEREREHISLLREFCASVNVVRLPRWRSVLNVGLNGWRRDPLQVSYYRFRPMHRLIATLRQQTNFDLAYIHLFRMAPFLADATDLYRIVDLTDVISKEINRAQPYRTGLAKAVYAVEKPRIERYERWVANHFEESWLISEADKATLAQHCPTANIQVVTNGIDGDYFRPLNIATIPHQLIFVGHMSVPHNVDAAIFLAQEILPLVRQQMPDTTLMIVGAEPSSAVQALDEFDGVRVTGFVPDLNHALNEAAVLVAPMRFAAGVQNKALEAMAAGCPVITTKIVADGIGAKNGTHLLVPDAESSDQAKLASWFAQSIISLLQSPDKMAQMSQAGRAFVTQKFNWGNVLQRVNQLRYSFPR